MVFSLPALQLSQGNITQHKTLVIFTSDSLDYSLRMLKDIDREFEFYEFFSFLKFTEFYKFFSVEKNSVKFVILQIIDV